MWVSNEEVYVILFFRSGPKKLQNIKKKLVYVISRKLAPLITLFSSKLKNDPVFLSVRKHGKTAQYHNVLFSCGNLTKSEIIQKAVR